MSEEKPVQKHDFKVDTRRHKSHAKRQSKIRHVLAVASLGFPLGAGFFWLMARLTLEAPERHGMHFGAACLLVAGMVSAFFWSIAVAIKNRRHENTRRHREERQRAQAEALRLEREKMAKRKEEERAAAEAAAGAGGEGAAQP